MTTSDEAFLSSLDKYFASVICRNYVKLYRDSMERDAFYGDFMIKLIWRLSGDLICYVISMETIDNLHTYLTIYKISMEGITLLTISKITILVNRFIMFSP